MQRQSYHEGNGQAYKNYGIDPSKGCSIILRPDQYVSWVGQWDDYEAIDRFFRGFMIEQPQGQKVEANGATLKNEYAGKDLSKGMKAGDDAAGAL